MLRRYEGLEQETAASAEKRLYKNKMSASSTFANSSNGHVESMNNGQEETDAARPSKRARISADADAAIQSQYAQEETSLEVDHMILDYLSHQSIKACLASREPKAQNGSSHSLRNNLAMSDAFLSMFRSRHPIYDADPELRFRIQLLKTVTLFTQRLTSNPTTPSQVSLEALRAFNQERARTWIDSAGCIPSSSFDITLYDSNPQISAPQLERNRAQVLNELGVPAEDEDYEDAFYGTRSCVFLLDLLPMFVQTSAMRNAMSGSTLTERWMHLACEFMLQACLEQYLVRGVHGTDPIHEAFAWGYKNDTRHDVKPHNAEANEDSRKNDVKEMFEDEENATEAEGWTSTKMAYLGELFRLEDGSIPSTFSTSSSREASLDTRGIASHLEMVAVRYPISSFETSLVKFFEALSNSIPEPILSQLEQGRLCGMTEQQTRDFLETCGIGPDSFFNMSMGSD